MVLSPAHPHLVDWTSKEQQHIDKKKHEFPHPAKQCMDPLYSALSCQYVPCRYMCIQQSKIISLCCLGFSQQKYCFEMEEKRLISKQIQVSMLVKSKNIKVESRVTLSNLTILPSPLLTPGKAWCGDITHKFQWPIHCWCSLISPAAVLVDTGKQDHATRPKWHENS